MAGTGESTKTLLAELRCGFNASLDRSNSRLFVLGLQEGSSIWVVLEFLGRAVDPIPEPSQQTVRHWGFYANAVRGKRRKAAAVGDSPPALGRRDDEFTRVAPGDHSFVEAGRITSQKL